MSVRCASDRREPTDVVVAPMSRGPDEPWDRVHGPPSARSAPPLVVPLFGPRSWKRDLRRSTPRHDGVEGQKPACRFRGRSPRRGHGRPRDAARPPSWAARFETVQRAHLHRDVAGGGPPRHLVHHASPRSVGIVHPHCSVANGDHDHRDGMVDLHRSVAVDHRSLAGQHFGLRSASNLVHRTAERPWLGRHRRPDVHPLNDHRLWCSGAPDDHHPRTMNEVSEWAFVQL